MNTQTLIVVAVAAIAAALLAWWFVQSRRRDHLRTRFGPEGRAGDSRNRQCVEG